MGLFLRFVFLAFLCKVPSLINAQSSREFAVPDPKDVLNKDDLPPLVFPGQKDVGLISGYDANLEDIRNKIKELKLKTGISQGAGSLLGFIPKAGGAIKATISTLAFYLGSVTKLEELKTDVKIQLGIDKAIAGNSLSLLKAELNPLKSRLEELLEPSTTNEEKKLSVVPATHSCQKIATLFDDHNYVMWNFKPIFTPYFLAFVSLYTTIARLAVELLPSKKNLLGDEMGLLLQTLNQYEPEVVEKMMKHIVIFNEYSLSKKLCPKIRVFWTYKNWKEWDTKIEQWKSPTFRPEKSGCVLGDPNSQVELHSSDVFHRGAKVFKNEISGELFCGWENCWNNLKQIYSSRIRSLFSEARTLFPDFTNRDKVLTRPGLIDGNENDPGCRKDSFGRLVYTKYSRAFGGADDEYGCHKGYCWAYCRIPFSLQNDWCYTGGPREKYTKCKRKEDCCPEWSCGGACWAY